MLRCAPHMPKKLRLPKTSERRIIALLSSLPRTEPEIKVVPLAADFEIELVDQPDYFVPLRVGEEAFYAEYDARDGHQFLEASFVRAARRVRSEGEWCLDVYETGGGDDNGRFSLCWDLVYHPRYKPSPLFTPTEDAKMVDDTYHFAGYATVTVGGAEHECMRLVYPYQSGDKPESRCLDEIYVSRDGRVVLRRRYRSLEEYTEWTDWLKERGFQRPYRETWEDDFTTARSRLTYNGQDFYHWFDTLTDLTLGRLISPEWMPPKKKRKGRGMLSWR